MKRELSQQEIDAAFQGSAAGAAEDKHAVVAFDFSRLDRIPKSQLRAVHLLHENFIRSLASNLSAYLRTHVNMNLVSLEQISYAEFVEGFASPTFIAYIGLHPYDGSAVMEMSPALVFTFVELLLGGGATNPIKPQRKISDIEKGLMKNLFRILLRELSEAWKNVTDIHFAVQSLVDEPQVLHVLAPAEAVVTIAIDVQVGNTTGLINLAIPSIFIKRLRHMFERLRRVHRAESRRYDQAHVAELLQEAKLTLEARLDGCSICAHDLMELKPGDVLTLDYPVDREAVASLNGEVMFTGKIAPANSKLGFYVKDAGAKGMASGPPAGAAVAGS